MSTSSLTAIAAHSLGELSIADGSHPMLDQVAVNDLGGGGPYSPVNTTLEDPLTVACVPPANDTRDLQSVPAEVREIAERVDRFVRQVEEIKL